MADKSYLEHVKALILANLVPKQFQLMVKIQSMIEYSKKKKEDKEKLKRRQASRQMYFCIDTCNT